MHRFRDMYACRMTVMSARRRRPRVGNGSARLLSDVLVQQQRLADVFDFGDGALEVECLGKDNLEDLDERGQPLVQARLAVAEYLLDVDAVAGAREDERRPHGLGKPARLGSG